MPPAELFELPPGMRMAVLFNVAYEGWELGASPGISPMGNPLVAGVLDTQAASWAAYGYRRGIWRLLDLLDDAQVRATVFTSGCLAEKAPDTIRGLVAGGHEVAAHGLSQHRLPVHMSRAEEEADVSQCLELLRGLGADPRGWLSPRGTPSPATAEIVAAAGLSWFGDVFDDDVPGIMETGSGPLVALPLKMEVNDLPFYMKHGNVPADMLRIYRDTFEAMYGRAGDGCYLDVTVHAHVFGRPYGSWVFATMLEEAKAHPDVWIPTRAELAAWTQGGAAGRHGGTSTCSRS